MNTIELKNNPFNGKTLVSLFAGCGGSSLGYKSAGYDIRLAVEWDKGAADIYRGNFPDTPLYEGDVNNLQMPGAFDMAKLKEGELDVLDGSPPCQGFSRAGNRKFADARNDLFRQYVRILRGMMPKAFIMENVSGLRMGKMKIIFSEMTRELKDSGYRVACRQLNAWWYGVPQSRERLIWVGIREDLTGEPSHPAPILRQPVSVNRALGLRDALINAAPGWSHNDWVSVPNTLRAGSRPGITIAGSFSFPKNAIADGKSIYKPSPSLAAIRPPMLAKETMTRKITIEEAKTLQSFPSSFRIPEYKYIGNSVPPLMAQAVGEHVASILDRSHAKP